MIKENTRDNNAALERYKNKFQHYKRKVNFEKVCEDYNKFKNDLTQTSLKLELELVCSK